MIIIKIIILYFIQITHTEDFLSKGTRLVGLILALKLAARTMLSALVFRENVAAKRESF